MELGESWMQQMHRLGLESAFLMTLPRASHVHELLAVWPTLEPPKERTEFCWAEAAEASAPWQFCICTSTIGNDPNYSRTYHLQADLCVQVIHAGPAAIPGHSVSMTLLYYKKGCLTTKC